MKHLYMMGGTMEGIGNITTTAEFNFYVDPEAGTSYPNASVRHNSPTFMIIYCFT